MTKITKRGENMATCNDCVCYITDEDENGNETEYHSARGLPEGFCSIKELIHSCKATDEACEEFVKNE